MNQTINNMKICSHTHVNNQETKTTTKRERERERDERGDSEGAHTIYKQACLNLARIHAPAVPIKSFISRSRFKGGALVYR